MPMVCDAPSILPNRQMVEMKTFERVSKRIERDHGFAPEIADQVLDATLGFLITCGQADQPLAPSEIVDLGWHTFLLYTPEYMGFCRKHVGHFVHHVPNDDPDQVKFQRRLVRHRALHDGARHQLQPSALGRQYR